MSHYPRQQPGYPPQQQPQQGYGYPQQPQQPGHFSQQPFGQPDSQRGFQQPPHFQNHGHAAPGLQQQQQHPQQGFGGPPPQGFGPPPSGQLGQHPPAFQAYPQTYGPPTMPSLGYDPNQKAQGNMINEVQALRKAMKGMGTDDKVLINILPKLDPLKMKLLADTYSQQLKRDLGKDVYSETSKHYRDTLMALIEGPLNQDIINIRASFRHMTNKETLFNDTILGRSNADLKAIKVAYQKEFSRSLEGDIKNNLKQTSNLFEKVVQADRPEENTPVDPQNIQRDAAALQAAMAGAGTKIQPIIAILTDRSDGQIRAIADAYHKMYFQTLEEEIKGEMLIQSHVKSALLLIVRRACDRAMADAVDLEAAMDGFGTKDELLLTRVVRLHWDPAHMDQVKRAYQHKFNKSLIDRVKSDTSGDYRSTLVACLE